jgi:predicted NBD/HSP70 family sugar kinase
MLGIRHAALPASLRRTNQRTVISLLQRLGTASRADLAKAAGLSQPTAGKIITELTKLGILSEVTRPAENGSRTHDAAPRLGRPGHMVRLDHRRPRFVAIELGVSETCVAALPVAAPLTDEWTFNFATPKSPEAWVGELQRIAASLHTPQLWGVLVSVPGVVNESAGKVLFSPNLHWLEKADVAQLAAQAWDLPILLVQEIRALARGHLAASPGIGDFLLVDFGQGVGGAVVLGGKVYESPTPASGELGHTPIPGNSRRCGCGSVGCLETLVSARGLLDSFAEAHQGSGPTWPKLVRHLGEHGVERWLAATLATTAKVIAGALNVLGLQQVVITGLLAELPPAVMELLAAEIRQGALWARFGEVLCESAPHRRAAGLAAVGTDRLVLPADERQGRIRPNAK